MVAISQLLFSLLSFVFLASAAPLGTPRVKPTTLTTVKATALTTTSKASSSTAVQFAHIGTPRVSPKASSTITSKAPVATPTTTPTSTATYPWSNQPTWYVSFDLYFALPDPNFASLLSDAKSYNDPLNSYACRLCTARYGEGVATCWQFGVITCEA